MKAAARHARGAAGQAGCALGGPPGCRLCQGGGSEWGLPCRGPVASRQAPRGRGTCSVETARSSEAWARALKTGTDRISAIREQSFFRWMCKMGTSHSFPRKPPAALCLFTPPLSPALHSEHLLSASFHPQLFSLSCSEAHLIVTEQKNQLTASSRPVSGKALAPKEYTQCRQMI